MGRTITPVTPGYPYDDGIYQADARYTPEVGITVNDLPGMCGQLAPSGQTAHCLRLVRTWHLHSDLEQINRDISTIDRMVDDRRARNLIGNVLFRIRRLAYQLNTWEFPPCTCAADGRQLAEPTPDLELIYPACAC